MTGGVLADDVLEQDRGFGGLAGHLVVIFQRHDQHGVRVFAEFDDVGHAADHRAVVGFGERRLVDRAVGGGEAVIGAIELPAGVVAVLRPASPRSAICRTRRARSRKPTRAASRLPVIVPSALSSVPP